MAVSLDQIKEMFDLFDSDGGGSIDTDEMMLALTQLGISESREEMEQIVSSIDADGSGAVEFDEFKLIIEQLMGTKDSDVEMQKAFFHFSGEKDKITVADLRRVADEVGEDVSDELLHDLMRVADRDGDGLVGFSEFRAMMMHMVQSEAESAADPARKKKR
eukprot:PhM_4_TR12538/c0_g1_i1/m.17294/K16465/CETN1; centrin-1